MLSVLVVDDDEIDIENVKRAFSKAKLEATISVAQNGIEALSHLRMSAAELVLLDINLPRMSGIEFLKELRKETTLTHTQVVVVTTSDEERDRSAASALGVTGYLVKPITPEKLLSAVLTLKKR